VVTRSNFGKVEVLPFDRLDERLRSPAFHTSALVETSSVLAAALQHVVGSLLHGVVRRIRAIHEAG